MKTVLVLTISLMLGFTVLIPASAAGNRGVGGGRSAQMGCLPTCNVTDGRFLALASGNPFAPLSGPELSLRVTVASGTESFQVGIFDADTGAVDLAGDSHWDRGDGTFEFQVLADGDQDGVGTVLAAEPVLSTSLPDNDWSFLTVERIAEAKTKRGTFSYVLRIENLDPTAVLINAFKIAVMGELLIEPEAQPFGIFTALTSLADAELVYPSFPDLQPTTYDGSLTFFLNVPRRVRELRLWDGDVDFGSFNGATVDTDDPETPAAPYLPPWATSYATPEGVAQGDNGGTGSPADDGDPAGMGVYLVRSPSPVVELRTPQGRTYLNDNPSGNQEWELFRVTTGPRDPEPADYVAPSLPPGFYTVSVRGIDFQNMTYWRFDHPVVCVTESGRPCGCQGDRCSGG